MPHATRYSNWWWDRAVFKSKNLANSGWVKSPVHSSSIEHVWTSQGYSLPRPLEAIHALNLGTRPSPCLQPSLLIHVSVYTLLTSGPCSFVGASVCSSCIAWFSSTVDTNRLPTSKLVTLRANPLRAISTGFSRRAWTSLLSAEQ